MPIFHRLCSFIGMGFVPIMLINDEARGLKSDTSSNSLIQRQELQAEVLPSPSRNIHSLIMYQ